MAVKLPLVLGPEGRHEQLQSGDHIQIVPGNVIVQNVSIRSPDVGYCTIRHVGALTTDRLLDIDMNNAARAFTMFGDLTVAATATVSNTNTGDQNLFSTIAVSGQSNVVADAASDTLTLVGAGISITTDAGTDSITFSSSRLVNAQTDVTYTYVAGDRGKLVTHSNALAIAGTLPQAGGSFPDGWFFDVQNRGVGTLTITPTVSTIDGSATLALTTGSGCRVFSDGTNYFTMRGIGVVGGAGTVSGTGTDNFLARWDGTTNIQDSNFFTTDAGHLELRYASALTNSSPAIFSIKHTTSDTAANNFGANSRWVLQTSDGTAVLAANLTVSWSDATTASRKARMIFEAAYASGTHETLRMESTGAAAAIGFLGASASAALTNPDLGTLATTFGLATGTPTFGAANLTGTVPHARLGSGGGGSTKFLREDSTWQTVTGGGDALVANNLDQFADVTQASGKTLAISDSTTLAGGTHSGTNTGDQTSVSGSSGSCTGNAATATALATARTINGVSFDGTANITVATAVESSALIQNLTLAATYSAGEMTIAVKTAAGTDPTGSDYCTIPFRSSTAATGTYTNRTITAANSISFTSGATANFLANVPGRLWIVAVDDGGTIRLGVVNCEMRTGSTSVVSSILQLNENLLVTTVQETSGADSAQVIYTEGAAASAKAFRILGYIEWSSGLSTAGTWTAHTNLQLMGPGVPLPGERVALSRAVDGAMATGTTVIPSDDTLPTNTEGDQFMSLAYAPSNACNVIKVGTLFNGASSSARNFATTLIKDSTCVASGLAASNVANACCNASITYAVLAGSTSSVTWAVRAGGLTTAGTTTFNGIGGLAKLAGSITSYIEIDEVMG